MDYQSFVKKYEYPELAIIDFLMQKADLFGDERRMTFFRRNRSPFCCLTFRNGINYLSIDNRCSLFVAKNTAEAKEIISFAKSYKNTFLHGGSVVILVIESNETINVKNGISFYGFKRFEKDADNYVPLFYDWLVSVYLNRRNNDANQDKTIQKEIDESSNLPNKSVSLTSNDLSKNNSDYSNKSVSLTSNDLSKNNLNLFKKMYQGKDSKCAFILGNGVSIPLGADSWERLINNLIDYLSPFYIKNSEGVIKELSKSNYLISSFVKSTFEEKGQGSVYIDGLKYCIYRKFNPEMLKEDSLLKAIALAKINKPELAIFTYNYDNFLEQQVSECDPSLKLKPYSGDDYKTYLNNGIIHLHGTIEADSKTLDEKLVLTDNDYFNAYLSDKNSWVYRAQDYALSNFSCLYIGSSMSDLFQLSIIEKVFERHNHKWNCFALMCFKKELEDNDRINLMKFYKNKGINVIFVDNHDKLASELNEITGSVFPVKKSYSPET